MAQYRLKQNVPDIEIVDGPFAGRIFTAGKIYTEIPEAEAARFEMIDSLAGFTEVAEDKGGE